MFSIAHINIFAISIISLALGLRHGLDVDHIVAIDNVTRNLASENRHSMTTGMFFALGHSTIVFLITLLVIVGVSNFINHPQDELLATGKIIGGCISITFLWLTALLNFYTLIKMIKNRSSHQHGLQGWLSNLVKPLFKLIDRPGKMYFIGLLFGLGFDTATEVALLSLAATSTLNGLSPWYTLILPITFACGMVITDSVDAILMTKVIKWANNSSSRYRLYNLVIVTLVTILAIVVSLLELGHLLTSNNHFRHWYLISQFADNHSALLGSAVVIAFTLVAAIIIITTKNAPLQKKETT